MEILLGILEQGLIYGVLALGLFITYRILNFPDLTVDGSFPLGAAITAALISRGLNPIFTMFISFFAGLIAGTITGIIHVKFKVRDLLSGIIVMTGLYTVSLTIAGQANKPIFSNITIFNNELVLNIFSDSMGKYKNLIIIFILVIILKILLDKYLDTKSGFLLKASGDNQILVRTLGKDPGQVKIFGLALANGLVALSGCILCQQQRFFEISMGTGSMVLGLASIIIGVKLFSKFGLKETTSVLCGSIVYKACVALAIEIGFSPNSLKLITATLFFIILVISRDKAGEQVN